jgi:hypothetical protein
MFLFGASVLLGVAYQVQVPTPQSLAALVPAWMVVLWSWGLLLSGAVGLVACFWRGGITVGLGFESGALLMSTAALLLIAAASFAVNGVRAVFGIGLIAAWGLANVARCLQIRHDLRQIAAAAKEHDDG